MNRPSDKKTCFVKFLTWFFIILFPLFFVACGGDQSAGIEGTGDGNGANIGTIASINEDNSITVNGIKQRIDSDTLVTVDGEVTDSTDLSVGQLVQISSEFDDDGLQADSTSINYISNVIGEITALNGATVTILEQIIQIGNQTVFGDDVADKNLELGQKLRVSGLLSVDGVIEATRIDLDVSHDYQIIGYVDVLGTLLTINEQVVDILDAPIIGDLMDNAFVRVVGQLLDDDNILIASEVEVLDNPLEEGATVLLEGLITTVDANNPEIFSVSGVDMRADFDGLGEDTIIINGDVSDILVDARVQIKGFVQVGNSLKVEQIDIIHTSPLLFTGVVEKGAVNTYSITTDETDLGVWLTLTDLDGWASLLLEQVFEDGTKEIIEENTALTPESNGIIFYPFVGEANWEVSVRGGGKEWDPDSISYTLKVFKRRAPFDEEQVLEVGEPIVIYQTEGSRTLYRVSTNDAPLGSFLGVRVDGLHNSGVIKILREDAELPERYVSKAYECFIGNSFKPNNHSVRNTCWVDNSDVSNWYIVLETYQQQRYTIYTTFEVPTELPINEPVEGIVGGDFVPLYKFTAPADATAVSILASDINHEDQNQDWFSIRLRADLPPIQYDYDCIGLLFYFSDEQCILPNQDETDWFAIAYGNEGMSYKMTAQVSVESHSIEELLIHDDGYLSPLNRDQGSTTEYIFEQSAATIRQFKIPKGHSDKVAVFGLEDVGDADFNLQVRDSIDGSPLCILDHTDTNERVCRLLDESEGLNDEAYWYIEVKSASSGSYRLWFAEQNLTALQDGIPLRDVLSEVRPDVGELYRIAIPEGTALFSAALTQATKLVYLVGRNPEIPSSENADCASSISGQIDREISCIVDYFEPPYAYLLVMGEDGAEYTITASTQ